MKSSKLLVHIAWENREEFDRLLKEVSDAAEKFDEALSKMRQYQANIDTRMGREAEQHGYEERNENTPHGRKVRQIEPTQVD